jgi:hypothetical protein
MTSEQMSVTAHIRIPDVASTQLLLRRCPVACVVGQLYQMLCRRRENRTNEIKWATNYSQTFHFVQLPNASLLRNSNKLLEHKAVVMTVVYTSQTYVPVYKKQKNHTTWKAKRQRPPLSDYDLRGSQFKVHEHSVSTLQKRHRRPTLAKLRDSLEQQRQVADTEVGWNAVAVLSVKP